MPPPLILDPATLDLGRTVADLDAIRRVNRQRFDMEQLTAVVEFDPERLIIAGYKDVRPDEFWVKGHMPDYPILPGVLICEAAAQLCSYFAAAAGVLQEGFLGFGGMDNVHFRRPVVPGDRLVLVARATRLRRRRSVFALQGFVNNLMVFDGDIIGIQMLEQGTAAADEED